MKPALLPRLGDTIFICIMLTGLLLGQRMLNLDSDLGRHLALGRYIIASGHIPTSNLLSFTRVGDPRPPYEWLSQIAFALVDRALGLDGVVLLTAAIIAAAFFVVYVDSRSRGGGALITVGLTIWAAAASSLHWLTRPHVFSFLFMAIWLRLLDRLRQGDKRAVWQLPLVMLLWANFHGGFVFGFVAWIAYAIGWLLQRRSAMTTSDFAVRLLKAGAASLATSLLTPGLGGSWSAVLRNSSRYVLSRTAETMPIAPSSPGTWPFLGLLILGALLAIGARRRLVAAHALLLLITAALGIGIMRNIPLFCIAAAPILAVWEREGRGPETRFRALEVRIESVDSRNVGSLWASLAVLLVAVFLAVRSRDTHRGFYQFDPSRFPVAAVDWMTTHYIPDSTLNDLNWGGYLLYRMWPEKRVFIDSQSDFYGEDFVRSYSALYEASGDWQAELDRYGILSAIVPPRAPIALELIQSAGWTIAYQDSTALVLVRRKN